ncbi:Hypothetical protein, putative [Bodo saltans]|uniref:Uncharacterized protein n=1 Tax=Bodo saltans TaxID=75058 RepID=A0A0S4JKQ7_BODSA|nr:Hypothetical protein, putative [Bodo saltans]|eukprot:CUG92129.1 Hypothetical protein, putative [Bodo saltans]
MVSHDQHDNISPVWGCEGDEAEGVEKGSFSVCSSDRPPSSDAAPPYCSHVEDFIITSDDPLDGTLIDITKSLMVTLQCTNWDVEWDDVYNEFRQLQPHHGCSTSNESDWSRPGTPPPPHSRGNSPLSSLSQPATPPPPPVQPTPIACKAPLPLIASFVPATMEHVYEERMKKYSVMTAKFLATLEKSELLRRSPVPDTDAFDVAGETVRRNTPYHSDVIPLSLVERDRVTVISYRTCFEPRTLYRPSPREHPQIKLGGVWMELGDQMIVALVERMTSRTVRHADMFRNNQGRCSLFLRNDEDTNVVISTLHRRVWLGPPGAVFAHSETAAERLQEYVNQLRQKSCNENHHWPRHLVTAEQWFTKSEYRKMPVQRSAPSLISERRLRFPKSPKATSKEAAAPKATASEAAAAAPSTKRTKLAIITDKRASPSSSPTLRKKK